MKIAVSMLSSLLVSAVLFSSPTVAMHDTNNDIYQKSPTIVPSSSPAPSSAPASPSSPWSMCPDLTNNRRYKLKTDAWTKYIGECTSMTNVRERIVCVGKKIGPNMEYVNWRDRDYSVPDHYKTDCSGFTWLVYNWAGVCIDKQSPTTQNAFGTKVTTPQVGDLVLVYPRDDGTIGHATIYIGNNQVLSNGKIRSMYRPNEIVAIRDLVTKA